MEDKIKVLEQLRTTESSAAALAALRRHISRPSEMFDRHEAIQLLQSLVRLARNENHAKADEYTAAADEIRARADSLEKGQLQRLFLGLLGDPVRAKIAKEVGAILKNVGKVPSTGQRQNAERGRLAPYSYANVQCFRCLKWGHLQRTCRLNSRGRPRGRGGRF